MSAPLTIDFMVTTTPDTVAEIGEPAEFMAEVKLCAIWDAVVFST